MNPLFSNSTPISSNPRFSTFARLPTATKTFSNVSFIVSPLFFIVITTSDSLLTSVISEFNKTRIPISFIDRSTTLTKSFSIPGNNLSVISKIVTYVPNFAKAVPNSKPIAPPPTTNIDFGT